MSKAIVTDAAQADMQEAYEWYAAKDSDLAGPSIHAVCARVMLCVRETVDAIEKAPFRYPVVLKNVRRARVAKFPFAMSYLTDGDSIVIACLHDRRDKKIVLDRLRALGPSPQ